jgi:hypothetical protein
MVCGTRSKHWACVLVLLCHHSQLDLSPWLVFPQTASGLPVTELLVGDVYNCTVFRFFPGNRPLSDIRDHDVLWMYHVPEAPGAAEVKAARKTAAEEAKKKNPYHSSYEPQRAENEADVVICLTRKEVWLTSLQLYFLLACPVAQLWPCLSFRLIPRTFFVCACSCVCSSLIYVVSASYGWLPRHGGTVTVRRCSGSSLGVTAIHCW